GGYAELAVANAAGVLPLPADWSFEEGASFPVVYATAYACLLRYGALRAGEKLLLQAAAGGVGIACTQIAGHVGAEIFGTASASKHDAIRGFGVDHAIDYRTQDFAKEVRRISGRSFKKGYSLLNAGGRIVCIGLSAVMEGEQRSVPRAIKTIASTPRFNV